MYFRQNNKKMLYQESIKYRPVVQDVSRTTENLLYVAFSVLILIIYQTITLFQKVAAEYGMVLC